MTNEKLALHGGEPVRTKPFPTVGDATGRDLGDEEIELLTQVIRSGSLNRNNGTMVREFEEGFSKLYGLKYATATTSGTAALHTAMGAINLDPGDEVITTTITDMGTVIAILMQNCIPIFADVDPATCNIDPDSVERMVTEKTRAIIPVHIFGQPCDMDPIIETAKRHDLWVIEDCAQAHLAEYKGRRVGIIGHLGCFSLQQSKQITTGDGGVVISNDDGLARRARLFADKFYARQPDDEPGIPWLGMNYRMTELQGAVALAQLRKVGRIVARRRKTAELLTELLGEIDGINSVKMIDGVKHSYWIYSFTIDENLLGVSTADFLKALNAEGIGFSVGYAGDKPIFCYDVLSKKQTYGRSHCPYDCPGARKGIEYREEDYPNTRWAKEKVCIRSWNEGMTEEDVRDIARGVRKVAEYYHSQTPSGNVK